MEHSKEIEDVCSSSGVGAGPLQPPMEQWRRDLTDAFDRVRWVENGDKSDGQRRVRTAQHHGTLTTRLPHREVGKRKDGRLFVFRAGDELRWKRFWIADPKYDRRLNKASQSRPIDSDPSEIAAVRALREVQPQRRVHPLRIRKR